MAHAHDPVALIALFFGLYYLAAGIGGLANPGGWARMVAEIGESAYGQFLGAVIAMLIGFILVAAVPPGGDWLAKLLFAIGCLALVEGMVFMMVPGRMLSLFRPTLLGAMRPFALFASAVGIAFCVIGINRL